MVDANEIVVPNGHSGINGFGRNHNSNSVMTNPGGLPKNIMN